MPGWLHVNTIGLGYESGTMSYLDKRPAAAIAGCIFLKAMLLLGTYLSSGCLPWA